MRFPGKLALLTLAALVAACGSGNQDQSATDSTLESKCTSMCNRGASMDCANAPLSVFDHATCIGACSRIHDMKADTDTCYAEASTFVNCLNGLSDVCAGFELVSSAGDTKACNVESTNYQTCVSDYCADHIKQDYCN
jgi:hypothetical protein